MINQVNAVHAPCSGHDLRSRYDTLSFMLNADQINALDPAVRAYIEGLQTRLSASEQAIETTLAQIARKDQEIHFRQTKIDKLTLELAVLKRFRFGKRSEQMTAEQRALFDESMLTDVAAIEAELDELSSSPEAPATDTEKKKPAARRAALPDHLPRREIRHEPENSQCRCGCALRRIGEDVSEKLDYQPGQITVDRHIRGKWVCDECETFTQAAMPAHIVDKCIATPGLQAHVIVSKYADHLPLYRQESILARNGLAIPRSTLAQWAGMAGVRLQPLVDAMQRLMLTQPVLHADETPVPMLMPGKGSTHRVYMWCFASTAYSDTKLIVYQFAEGRGSKHAFEFFGTQWKGTLVCDDYKGYEPIIESGVTEAGCMAHARRKFYDLYVANKSAIAKEAIDRIAQLYAVESEVATVDPDLRRQIRQQKAKPICDEFKKWLIDHLRQATEGTALYKAIHYALNRWDVLVHYLDDGHVPIDNNHLENRIRPITLGRNNWLFAGSLRGGRRAAAIMSLIQSAKLNGHDPFVYIRDVLERLPTQLNKDIEELLPHRWKPAE